MSSATDNNRFSFALRILIGLAAAGLVLYFMHLMSDLINNLFVAFMITVTASPLLQWMREKGTPNWLAFTLTLAAVAVGLLFLVAFIANAAAELGTAIPKYYEEAQDLQDAMAKLVFNLGLVDFNIGALLEIFEMGKLLQAASSFISSVLDALGNVVIIILFVVFMLVQVFTTPVILRREIVAGNVYLKRVTNYIKNLRQYLVITAIIALVTGGLDTIWFIILGIPNPVLWGGVAAILSFVPSIGFWLAAIPPTLLALFEGGPLIAVITLAGILFINGFADNVIKPRFLGEGLDLAPFMVVFSVIFWAIILGPIGAIIGVPMTMLVKSLLFEADEDFDWVAHLMGSGLETGQPTETLPED
jgi:AI-2 transport protein TqsA